MNSFAGRQVNPGTTKPTLSSRRSWLFRCFAAIVLPLVLVGGLELILRLTGYGCATGFFEKVHVGGKDFLINNENFSSRFFPPQLARVSGPVMMEAAKPANTHRIFILGESAARGEPLPAYAASRYLEALLNDRFPKTHFEVVNLGITAINSHVILPIARDCAKADGDLWIIFMGNNEMVGPFGAATVFGAKAPPLRFVRLDLAIQSTRVGQLMVDMGRRMKRSDDNASWGGMKMFAGNQLRADDSRKEIVYQNFERNLNDMVQAGLDSGAKILLNTVAVNLKDCSPFASLVDGNLSVEKRAQLDAFYSKACLAAARGSNGEAAQLFEQAAKLDPRFAELQYRWGECSLALSNLAGARDHFQNACDDDALPFRADSRINGTIRKVARQFAGNKLTFFDAAAEMATNGVCGREGFFEHVHFNFDGNFRLGRAWAEQVERMLPADVAKPGRTNAWATQETCNRLLALTAWNQCAATEAMIDRLHRPPFINQSNNAEQLQWLRDDDRKLRHRVTQASAQSALETYLTAINRAPQDHLLHENFAVFLESAGDLKQAVAQWQQVQDLLPYDCMPFYEAGRLLSKNAQWDQAEAALTKAVKLRPRLAEGWFELGGVHLAAGKFEIALVDHNRARELDPRSAIYCTYAGKDLSKLDRRAEAMELFRMAIRMEPGLWEAHFALGDELAASKQLSEAESEYKQVTQLQPTIAMAHLDRGVMLAQLGQLDAALLEFQETLRLDSGNKPAQGYLERVTSWKKQRHQ